MTTADDARAHRCRRRRGRPRAQGGLAAVLALALAAGCGRPATRPEPAAGPQPPDARTAAVYRTVAESVYVRSTGQPVAIAAVTTGAPCDTAACAAPAAWTREPLWWGAADSLAERAARADLEARWAPALDLRGVPEGHAALRSADVAMLPAHGAAVEEWRSFRERTGGAAGVVRFSPVGFADSGRRALVYVDWRCGPTCGHTLGASLAANADGTWRIAEVILLSSRRAVSAR